MKHFLRTCIILLALPVATSAVAIAPENLPSTVEVDDTPLVDDGAKHMDDEDIADELFPELTIEAPVEDGTDSYTVGGIMFFADDIANINEPTTSDVYAAGNSVSVNAQIGGDVFAAGNTVDIDGAVEGSVRAAGNTVTISEDIDGNLLVFANSVTIEEGVTIGGHVNAYAATITVDGDIEGKADMRGDTIIVNGMLANENSLFGESVLFQSAAELQQKTTVTSRKEPTVHTNSIGTDYITYKKPKVQKHTRENQITRGNKLQEFLGSYFVMLLIGVIVLLAWPKWSDTVVKNMEKKTAYTWQVGTLFFVLAPLALIALVFTILGIPFAVVGSILYIGILWLGRMFAGMWLGTHIVPKKRFSGKHGQRIVTFIVGYFLLAALFQAPLIGWMFGLLSSIWGAGAMLSTYKRKKKSSAATATKKRKSTSKKKKSSTSKK